MDIDIKYFDVQIMRMNETGEKMEQMMWMSVGIYQGIEIILTQFTISIFLW